MNNKKRQRLDPAAVFLVIAALAALGVVFWPDGRQPVVSGKPLAGATIFPLYDIVSHVAGDEVGVILLTPPGASPHTFEPRPSDLRKIKGAAVIYAIGHGLDNWVTEMAAAGGAAAVVVDRGIDILPARGEEAGSGGGDPHYWLDAANAAKIAATVADDLARRYPASAGQLRRNLDGYLKELAQADAAVRAKLSGLDNRDIVTLHDAWYYFARAYGLTIAGSFEPTAGREPTPQYLAALQEAVRSSGVRTVYAEPQLSVMSLKPFAQDNGLAIVTIDPEGGLPGRDTYISLLLYNADIIRENQR